VTLNKRTRIRTAAIAVGVLFGLATGIGGYTLRGQKELRK
jgi:hypothetical protein